MENKPPSPVKSIGSPEKSTRGPKPNSTDVDWYPTFILALAKAGTEKALAEYLSVHRKAIYRYKNYQRVPSQDSVERLIKYTENIQEQEKEELKTKAPDLFKLENSYRAWVSVRKQQARTPPASQALPECVQVPQESCTYPSETLTRLQIFGFLDGVRYYDLPITIIEKVLTNPEIASKELAEAALRVMSLVTDPRYCWVDDFNKKGWRRLSWMGLRVLCGKKTGEFLWNQVEDILVRAGLLEIYYKFKIGKRCRMYRCKVNWAGARLLLNLGKLREFVWKNKKGEENQDLSEKTEITNQAKSNEPPSEWGIGAQYIRKTLRALKLDIPHAMDSFCTRFELSKEYVTDHISPELYQELTGVFANNEKALAHLYSIYHYWQNKSRNWCTQDAYGRIHTPATCLPKYLRKSITIHNNSDLISVDAKNSQLVFMALEMRKDHVHVTRDGAKWFELVQSKVFYEEIYQLQYGRYPTEEERSAFKSKFFRDVLYGTVWMQLNSQMGKIIQSKFPTVYDWILEAKKQEGYAELARQMQRDESYLFIKKLMPVLQEVNVPLYHVHDSITVRRQDEEKLLAALTQVFSGHGVNFRFMLDRTDGTHSELICSGRKKKKINSAAVEKSN